MDWNFIREYTPMFAEAAGLTARVGLKGIILAIGIGLVGSIFLYYKVPVIQKVLRVHIPRNLRIRSKGTERYSA